MQLLREVESSKNRLFNRSGFAPVQRMFGHTPRTNGELLSDDLVDPVWLDAGEDMNKVLTARRAAQKAFAVSNTLNAVKITLRSKGRTHRNFQPGEVVFVRRSRKSQGVFKPGWVYYRTCDRAYAGGSQCLCECPGTHLEGVE